MNKKLIALAVAAGMAAPMIANAGVTPYGQLQIELGSVSNDGIGSNNDGKSGRDDATTDESALSVQDNKRGRLGMKASEDLGNGLKAIAKFEWQVDTGTGDIYDGQRESWVGMKGNFGEIKAGRIKMPYKYTGGVKYDPLVTTYAEARKNGGMSGGTFGHNSFADESVSYKNKFGAVSFWVALGMDEGNGTDANVGNDGDTSVGLKFKAMKNLEIIAATASDDSADYDATKFGGQWKAGPHKVSLQLESIDAAGTDTDVTFLGYQFKMGKNTFVAQMGESDTDGAADTQDYMGLGVIHKFSKKTRVFVTHGSEEVGSAEYSATSVGMRMDF